MAPVLGLMTVAALALTACSPAGEVTEPDAERGTYSIYASLSLTGPLAGSSQAQLEGLEIAVDVINENGGINGETVELTHVDDQLDPTKAVTLLQEQLDVAKPDLVIHGVSSSVALAMLPLLTREEVLSTGTPYSDLVNVPATNPYAFGTNPVVALDPQAMAKLFKEKGYKKVAYLGGNDALGQSISAAFESVLTKGGYNLQMESYAPADLDMTAQLQRLQAGNPDVLIIQGYGSAAGYALKSRTKLGWDIVTYGDGGLGNGNNLALISDEADWDNLFLRVFAINTDKRASGDSAAYKRVVSELQKRGSKFDQLTQLYAFMWDALHVVKQAVEQADAKDAKSVAAALEDLGKVKGDSPFIAFPEVRYSSTNHFLNLTPDAYIVVRPGPVVNGTIKSVK